MTADSIRSRVDSVRRDLSSLQKKVAEQTSQEAAARAKAQKARTDASKARSPSSVTSKLREAERAEASAAAALAKRADLDKKIASKTAELHKLETQLGKAIDDDRKKALRKIERDADARARAQGGELKRLAQRMAAPAPAERYASLGFDVFVSHASEDKDEVARPLAEALEGEGLKVWFDEATLRIGDNLRRRIDEGLARCRFGLVILSPAFFDKPWPQYELDGLVTRQLAEDTNLVLPVWHHVSKDDVMRRSPPLANLLALNTSTNTIVEIAAEVAAVVRT